MAVYWGVLRATQSPTGQALIKKIERDLNIASGLAAAGAAILVIGDTFLAWFEGDEPSIFADSSDACEVTPSSEGLPGDTLRDFLDAGYKRVRSFDGNGGPIQY